MGYNARGYNIKILKEHNIHYRKQPMNMIQI